MTIHFSHKHGDVVENQPITRTINLHQPDGTTVKTEVQTGTATRTNTKDLVTDTVLTYGKWSGGLTQYQIPQIENYVSQVDNNGTRVDQSSIDGTSFSDQDSVPSYNAIDVYYRTVPAYTVVNYKDADGNIIKTENVGGNVGDKKTITADEVPDGYELVPGQDTSKEVTLTNDNPGQPKTPIVFNIQQKVVKVTHDAPKNAGDIIEKNFTYPQGVSEEDLNRTATRTINVIDPKTGKTITSSQTVKFYRDATVNEVTGKVVYTDWQIASDSPQKSWSAWTIPATPGTEGYIPTISSLPAETPTAETGDKEYTITYTNQAYTTHVTFKDADGTVLRVQTITGVTGTTASVDQKLPAGYKLKDGESIPTSITFDGDPVADKEITLEHIVETLTDKTPDFPNGYTSADFKRTVTRTINVYSTDGQNITKTVTQTATFTRTATYDKATNQITFGNWSVSDGNANFAEYNADQIDGYTPTTKASAVTVTEADGNSTVNIHYTPNDSKVIFEAYDQASGKDVQIDLDSIATNTDLAGKVDQAVNAQDASDREGKIKNLLIKLGYQYVENSATPTPSKFTADTQTIKLYFTHQTSETPEEKTVTRKINIPGENGKIIEVTQTATVHRTNTTDKVTGATTPGEWSKAEFPEYDASQVDGKTTYVDGKETTTVPSEAVKIVNGVPQNGDDVTVTYEANPGTQTIKYVDEKGNPIKFSDGSEDQVISGKVGEIKEVNTTIPDGYELVPGETIPGAIDIKKTDSPIIVTLKAKTVTVTPDNPQNEGSEIPDNPGKTFPKGVSESDLNRTVTRKIIEDKPTGSVTVSDESVKFTRTATVNVATGAVTYSEWTVVPNTNNKFSEYVLGDNDQVWGYTASRSKVDESTPSVEAGDQEIHITYAKDTHTVTIDYVDSDNGNAIVHQTIVTGKTGDTKTVTPEIPDGYELAKDSSVPGSVDFSKPTSDQTVKLVHKITTLTDETPNLPNGLTSADLKHTVTRTINVYSTDGQTITKTVSQTATFKRTATYDEVSKKITLGDWTLTDGDSNFAEYNADPITGYTPTTKADAITVNRDSGDSTVNIYYTPDDSKVVFEAYDQASGKDVQIDLDSIATNTDLAGKVDEAVSATDASDREGKIKNLLTKLGYQYVANSTTPTPDKYTTAVQTIKLYFTHQTSETPEDKTVTRVITIPRADGSTAKVTQTVTVHRTNTTDKVTGKTTPGEWSKAEFPGYDAGSIPGHTTKVDGQPATSVPSEAVKIVDGEPQNGDDVTVTYDANPGTQTIKYVDENGNPVGSDQVLKGNVGDKETVNQKIEDGYELTPGETIPSSVEIKDTDTPIIITLRSKKVTVTPDNPKNPGDPITEVPGKTYPKGVSESDLNRTVTRKIIEDKPDGSVTVSDESVKFTRTATINVATGAVTYSEWTVIPNTNNKFSEYVLGDSDQVTGYTASRTKVDESTPSVEAGDQEIHITYTKTNQTATINYVDTENGDAIIHQNVITGRYGDKKEVPSEIPDGYEIAKDSSEPKEIDFSKPTGDITVKLVHKTTTYTGDEPDLPEGVVKTDLQKTVTRVVTVYEPDGKTVQSTKTDQATFKRTLTVDQVTGGFTWSPWTTSDKTTFDAVQGTEKTGYVAQSTPSVTVNENSSDMDINLYYLPLTQQVTVETFDNQTGKEVELPIPAGFGKAITGNTNHEVPAQKLNDYIAALKEFFGDKGYQFVSQSTDPTNFGTKDQVIKLIFNHPGIDVSNTDPDAKKLVTRTITIKYPGGKTQEITQTAVATRTATKDPVTKEVTYGDWTGGFKEFTAPVLPNYVSQVDGKDAESVPSVTFDKNHEPSDASATIDYHTKPSTQTIKYINDKGEVVKTQVIDGNIGDTHKVTGEIPTGYEVAKGFTIPGEVTIQPNDNPILIPIISKTVEVSHTDPKNPGDEIPNNPGKTFPDGVKKIDLNRDVTRKIIEHKPSGDVTVQDQTVHFVRDAKVNVDTGEITYTEWKVDGDRSKFDEYTLGLNDQVPGYIASRIKIDASTPSENAGDQVIDVDYRPIQTIKFRAIDKDGNDAEIPLKNASLATLISGEGGDKVDDKQVYSYVQAIRSELEPRGYEFINYDNIPELIKEIKDGIINVYFKHQIIPVKPGEGKTPEEPVRPGDPESPKYPEGVENKDLTTPITRIINVKYPAGYSEGGSNAEHTETQTQVVQYKRTAQVDKVTGKLLGYTDGEAIGTDTWSEYVPDVAKGYGLTKESEQAPEVHVKENDKDVVVNMEIVPLPQKLIVKAYDAGKKVVVEVPFDGVTYQTINSETVKKTVDDALKDKGYIADWTGVEIPTRYDNDVDVDQIVELHTNLIPSPTPEQPTQPEKSNDNAGKTPESPAKSTGKQDEPKATTPLTPEANIHKDVAKKITSSSSKLPQTGNESSSTVGLGLAAMAVASLIGLAGKKRKKDDK
ncbi:mucin-binding protein [Lactobacillus mulieris]|uniref:mucin-binding protein n=1 Tax=Lactobacillus mulieris TaxID=2508708 RepID=UPI0036F48710